MKRSVRRISPITLYRRYCPRSQYKQPMGAERNLSVIREIRFYYTNYTSFSTLGSLVFNSFSHPPVSRKPVARSHAANEGAAVSSWWLPSQLTHAFGVRRWSKLLMVSCVNDPGLIAPFQASSSRPFYRCHLSTARGSIVQSAVLRLHVLCPSVCDVGGSGSHSLEILETKCTDN